MITRAEETLRRLCLRDRAATPRTLVLAAHPDDDVIGAGARLGWLRDPRVVYLTDGAPRALQFVASGSQSLSRDAYAKLRAEEAREALALAGVTRIRWLGGIDQEAVGRAVSLTHALAELLMEERPEALLVQPYEGGHPDHDAAALCARAAIDLVRSEATAIEMTAYHADGERLATGVFLGDDPGITLPLDDRECARKRSMLATHASQHETLRPFDVAEERFRIAPRYDFTRPPHHGPLHYERLGFRIDGAAWREAARRAWEGMCL